MSFKQYVNQAWADHATDAKKVAAGFQTGLSLVTSNEELDLFARLVTHVLGEHLGQWDEGIATIDGLRKHATFILGSEADKSLTRYHSTLRLCKDSEENLATYSNSDQLRILSMAAAGLAERETSRALSLFQKSLRLAELGLPTGDPAFRALAVTGNNLAATLEEKSALTPQEKELMIVAAKTGRKYWALAGGWLEISRAEYRLAKCFLKTADKENAFLHAQLCVEICVENKADDLDMFYAYEILAHVEKARENTLGWTAACAKAESFFEKLSPKDQDWCKRDLKRMKG